jgi:hypothetical protein
VRVCRAQLRRVFDFGTLPAALRIDAAKKITGMAGTAAKIKHAHGALPACKQTSGRIRSCPGPVVVTGYERFEKLENFILMNQVLQFAHSALTRLVVMSVAHLSACCRGLGDVQAAMAINQKPSGFPAGPLSGKARGVSSKSRPY